MRPSLPVALIARMPLGGNLALRLYNRALMHLWPKHQATTYFGATMRCDVRDLIQATLIHFRAWEPNVSRTLEGLIQPGDTVLDIGANIGYYTLLFAQKVGAAGKVIAIEAHPRFASITQDHVRLNGHDNVRLMNVAVSDRPGQVTLYEGPSTNIGSTTLRRESGFTPSAVVKALPIMDILEPEEVGRISLIKIDIEGAEIPVLGDLLDSIDRFPRRLAMAVEANVQDDERWRDMFARFTQLGFEAFDMKNDYDWGHMLRDQPSELERIDQLPDRVTEILFRRGAA